MLKEIKHFKIYDAGQRLMQRKINIGEKSSLTSGNANGLNIFHLVVCKLVSGGSYQISVVTLKQFKITLIEMATAVKVLICLSWFVYLADTERFMASHYSAQDDIILQTSTRDRLTCSGLCTQTDGCNSFSFTKADRHCQLARHASYDAASNGVVYARVVSQPVSYLVTIQFLRSKTISECQTYMISYSYFPQHSWCKIIELNVHFCLFFVYHI